MRSSASYRYVYVSGCSTESVLMPFAVAPSTQNVRWPILLKDTKFASLTFGCARDANGSIKIQVVAPNVVAALIEGACDR
jgi:hypothetical protein